MIILCVIHQGFQPPHFLTGTGIYREGVEGKVKVNCFIAFFICGIHFNECIGWYALQSREWYIIDVCSYCFALFSLPYKGNNLLYFVILKLPLTHQANIHSGILRWQTLYAYMFLIFEYSAMLVAWHSDSGRVQLEMFCPVFPGPQRMSPADWCPDYSSSATLMFTFMFFSEMSHQLSDVLLLPWKFTQTFTVVIFWLFFPTPSQGNTFIEIKAGWEDTYFLHRNLSKCSLSSCSQKPVSLA